MKNATSKDDSVDLSNPYRTALLAALRLQGLSDGTASARHLRRLAAECDRLSLRLRTDASDMAERFGEYAGNLGASLLFDLSAPTRTSVVQDIVENAVVLKVTRAALWQALEVYSDMDLTNAKLMDDFRAQLEQAEIAIADRARAAKAVVAK